MLDENLSVWPGSHRYIPHWRTEWGTALGSSVTVCSGICVSLPTSNAHHAVNRQCFGLYFAPCDGKSCQDSKCRKKSWKFWVSSPALTKEGENKRVPALTLAQKGSFRDELMVDCQFWWMGESIPALLTKIDIFYVTWSRGSYFFWSQKFAKKHTCSSHRGIGETHPSELVFIHTKLRSTNQWSFLMAESMWATFPLTWSKIKRLDCAVVLTGIRVELTFKVPHCCSS